ncbi:MAG: transporter substrate-binding domain-containing protein [Deltaproteobacteria bacterium]|nr:transporter substrate-binding domain-containing protein [Deltaproteobacteria bacterium]MBT4269561.1 transporter substrate-binding domain-containing protein [Deltaproteobacteria bacterium]MBT4642110.1 transporter substrate-binding domain-containing protein [Deltaproteobacteria bacterium]MBT6612573.1 transporter substrate-binding domain-containing protein [Deltaproteobacteria bacterium]MBT7711941.1 transporter substrate-binding domain-containing protein [Deltaproteobacteria bacterium]
MKQVILLVVFLIASNLLIAEEKINLMTEILPPFQYYDEEKVLTGISIEIIDGIKTKIKSNDPIKVVPWSRGLKIVKKKGNSALFSMLRTPEREEFFKWVGPLVDFSVVFFKKSGSPIQLSSVKDAKKIRKIGVTKNVGNHEMLLAMGFQNLDVLQSGADEKNIKKLVKGRIDLWPTTYFGGLYNAKKLGYEGMIEPIVDFPVFEGQLYLAFNAKTKDSVIKKWQIALDSLKLDGTLKKIVSKYR